jgi:Myb-like DNA-binding domain
MKDWSAKDELQLLQGIMKCGLGNWKEVSDQYVKTHSSKECEEHYYTFFNKSRDDHRPNPDDYIIMQRFQPATRSQSYSQQSDSAAIDE